MERNKVVLVDTDDYPLGEMDKMEAHRKGLLHRAFSVFLFNSNKEMLLHQRAFHKYHGAGLWTNACCSHPQMGEQVKSGALERLYFEMGLRCELEKVLSFIYRAQVENGLIEYEYDHVYIGFTDERPVPNPAEVAAYRWVSAARLRAELRDRPESFTIWFRQVAERILAEMERATL